MVPPYRGLSERSEAPMPTTADQFLARLSELRAELTAQGRRVQQLLDDAFACAFSIDAAAAPGVIAKDDEIDRVDVEIERTAVALLSDLAESVCALPEEHLRMVLTVVKVNNEYERAADCGVAVAELVTRINNGSPPPLVFRVMANSTVGIMRDTVTAMDKLDANLARLVLTSESTVEKFKRELLREIEGQVAKGETPVDDAFRLHEIATKCLLVADHCSNVAEQVLYVATGEIYRHIDTTGWTKIDRK